MTLCRSAAIYFFTLTYWVIFWILLLPPVLVALCFPAKKRRHLLRLFLLWFGRSMVRLVWRPFFRVDYRDRTDGTREPGIIVVNHRSATDAFLVSVMGICAAQTVNGWPMRLPVIGWMARLAGYLNITDWDHETLKDRAGEVLASGDMIISYPEGTRSEGTKMNQFHSGIFRVAMELGVPVYMLCIAGNQFMPDRKFRFREFRDLPIHLLGPVSGGDAGRSSTAYVLKQKIFRLMELELAEMDKALENGTV